MTFRVFWNTNCTVQEREEHGEWIVDTGPSTPRLRVHHVIFACFPHTAPPSSFPLDGEQHPRAWCEASGELRIERGVATISAFFT